MVASSRLRFVVLLLALVPGAMVARAQELPRPSGAVWEVAPEVVLVPEAHERLPGERERYRLAEVPLRADALGPGDALELALPERRRAFTVTRVERYRPGLTTATAVAADGSGEVAVLTSGPRGTVGVLGDGAHVLHLFPTADGPVLVRAEPDALACGVGGEHLHTHAVPTPAPAEVPRALVPPHMPALAATDERPVTIDLAIPYTPRAAAWAANNAQFGSIDVVIAQAMGLSQQALDNSRSGVRLRLVDTYEVDYDESTPPPEGESGFSSWHLRRLTAGPNFNPWGEVAAGFMEEVHFRRDLFGADLVALFAEVNDVGGIAWLLSSLEGRPQFGFSVNRVQQMATTFTLVHEIGHNMGLAHGRDQPTAAASPQGGLFPYAVGWRWTGQDGQGYHSVMSYGRSGDRRVGHFSNPEVVFAGVPTGEADPQAPFGPADAARVLREVRRVVAAYRPTRIDPPTIDTGGPIVLEVARNEAAVRTLTIANTGRSDLVWEIDVVPLADDPPLAAAWVEPEAETLRLEEEPYGSVPAITGDGVPLRPAFALSPSALLREADVTVIYATDFEAVDGFQLGTHLQHQLWTSRLSPGFEVATANPARGAQHLRVASSGADGQAFVLSPYFGAWPTGRYVVTADVAVSSTTAPPYFIVATDGRSGRTLGGWALWQGNVFAFQPGSNNFTSIAGWTWTPGAYRRYTMVVDPEARRVRYFVDGTEAASRPLPAETAGIGQLRVSRNPGEGMDHLDLDGLRVEATYLGLAWLQPAAHAGVTPPGQTSTLDLAVPAGVVEPGTYRAEVVVRSNDPQLPERRVPVTLVVGTHVGTEASDPVATRLLGSHPNPFTRSARVAYHLARPEHVTLELFAVTGRRVAVLVDELQPAGPHEAVLDGTGLASGVYLVRFRAGDVVETRRVALVR